MGKPANDSDGPASAASKAEVLGTVKRVVKRPLTNADRLDNGAAVHALLGARAGVERQRDRAQKAVAKLRKRLDALQEQLDELHARYEATDVEAIVELRVERTPNEIRLVVPDTGAIHYQRPLTAEERAVLDTRPLPGVQGPRVHHPELDQDQEAAKLEERERMARVTRTELAQPITLEQVFEEVDAEEAEEQGDSDKDAQPKGKGGRKGKSSMKQTELPLGKE